MELSVLKKEATTKSLITKNSHNAIEKDIKKYLDSNEHNFIITSENIQEVKTANADLNKTAKLIREISKEIVDRETESVTHFKSNMKIYLELIEKKRLERVEAIEVFESKTKETLKQLLNDYKEKNIGILREEFNKVEIEDLVKLTNITAKGVLAKGGKDGINAKIQVCLNQQNRYDLRIANLKVICLENGLKEVLTVDHIQGIIYEDIEEKYQDELLALIVAEIDRVAKIEVRVQEELEETVKINNDALLKKQLEDKYFPLIPTATNDDINRFYSELTNYENHILLDINFRLNTRRNELLSEKEEEEYPNLEGVHTTKAEQQPDSSHLEYKEAPQAETQTEPKQEQEFNLGHGVNHEPASDGKKMVQVRLTYNVRVPVAMTTERILEKVVPMITKDESKQMLANSEVL